MITTKPNLRTVRCCGNCQHGETLTHHFTTCNLYEVDVQADEICDDYKG